MKPVRSRAGAMLWVLTLQFFVVEQVVSRGWSTPYNFARNYVSDLGALRCGFDDGRYICSPLHVWMNASFLLQGLLIFFGALLIRRAFSPRRGFSVGLGDLAASGVGVMLVALAPEDVSPAVHLIGAVTHFIGAGVAMIVVGTMLTQDRRRSAVAGWASVGLGVAVVGATVLLGLRGTAVWGALGWPVGCVERLPAYAIPLWLCAMGANVLVRDQRPGIRIVVPSATR